MDKGQDRPAESLNMTQANDQPTDITNSFTSGIDALGEVEEGPKSPILDAKMNRTYEKLELEPQVLETGFKPVTSWVRVYSHNF